MSTDQPESLELTINKNKEFFGVNETFTVIIPKSNWNDFLTLALPDKYTDCGPDKVQVGTLMIKYKERTRSIMLYWAGKNPCKVTLDGRDFFYAKNNPDLPDGATELVRKALQLRSQIEREKKTNKANKNQGNRPPDLGNRHSLLDKKAELGRTFGNFCPVLSASSVQ